MDYSRLNPYSLGICSVSFYDRVTKEMAMSLNPYSIGICSVSANTICFSFIITYPHMRQTNAMLLP